MAVISTPRCQSIESTLHSMSKHLGCDNDIGLEATLNASSSKHCPSVLSIVHDGVLAIPTGHLFGRGQLEHNHKADGTPGIKSKQNYGKAPLDGDIVWFCSACGDGPYAGWRDQCISCEHVRCGACKEEEL